MLQIDNLHAFYGKSHVLHGVNFEVRQGEIVAGEDVQHLQRRVVGERAGENRFKVQQGGDLVPVMGCAGQAARGFCRQGILNRDDLAGLGASLLPAHPGRDTCR